MSLLPHQLELLSPARDADIGIEAINHGADAVYIGGPAFGARASAGNDIRDIERLVKHARRFNSRIFITLNTILRDDELEAAAAEGPCDILTAAGNPCVAAHSTVRALYAQYAGPLYRVTRPLANNASANISAVGPGGFADSAAHGKFCAKLNCVISEIFDQSPQGNHLRQRISDSVVHNMVPLLLMSVFVIDSSQLSHQSQHLPRHC